MNSESIHLPIPFQLIRELKKLFFHCKSKRAAANPEITAAEESNCLVTELPHVLMMDILSRLPIKSLFYCKCVCKTWLHLISDPQFVKLHFAKSSTTILIQDVCIRYLSSRGPLLASHVLDEEEGSTRAFEVTNMRFSPNINLPDTSFLLVNSCNGLVCLRERSVCKIDEMIYVCNPILGEYITIPVVNEGRAYSLGFAFGFSFMHNQYKVLRFFCRYTSYSSQFLTEVYTVGTGQWRSIGNTPLTLGTVNFDVFLHDSMHWVGFDKTKHRSLCVFYFGCEQFRQWPFPPDSHNHEGNSSLGILKGCLFLALQVCWAEIDMWVMEEYGVKESWSKRFVIGNASLNSNPFSSYQPLIFLSSGEILMFHETLLGMFDRHSSIICYDSKQKSFHDARISAGMKNIKVTAYSPSFVTLQDIAGGEDLRVLRCRTEQNLEKISNFQAFPNDGGRNNLRLTEAMCESVHWDACKPA